MCLCVSRMRTDAMRARLKRNGWVTCWKVVRATNRDDYWPHIRTEPRLVAPYMKTLVYKPGVNKSTRTKPGSPNYGNGRELGKGIHVCVNRAWAKDWARLRSDFAFVPVKCYKKHFVACGQHDALFTQVTLSESAYRKAIAQIKRGQDGKAISLYRHLLYDC